MIARRDLRQRCHAAVWRVDPRQPVRCAAVGQCLIDQPGDGARAQDPEQ